MLTDQELWACAVYLKESGARAHAYVAEQIAILESAGDQDGAETWRQIAARLQQIRNGGSNE
jgi:ribosomal protein L18E